MGDFFLDKRDALVYKYIQLREKAGQRNRLIIRKKNSRQVVCISGPAYHVKNKCKIQEE